jgi:nicotinamide-nucleotide amidase
LLSHTDKPGDFMITSAHIIAVGDEVLWGETVNTNAAWMAHFLMSFGVRPTSHQVVADDEQAIGDALGRGLKEAALVVVMGGLGPTADDRTLEGVARALGRGWELNAEVLQHISGRHGHASGWRASVRRQARTIAGAEVWLNRRGQAPGQLIPCHDRWVVLLPGPPREMQGIAEEFMARWLSARSGGGIHRDSVVVFDVGESAAASHLWPLLDGAHPKAGIYAQPGRVDIRIETPDSEMGQVVRARALAWLQSQLPVPGYSEELADRETYLIHWLVEHGLTVAAMESVTGGMLLARLIGVPGASEAVGGGVVAYTNAAKQHYGVRKEILDGPGAVSAECATAMARAVREEFQAFVGVATTGYAGPGGGDEQHPVGTFFVAAASDAGVVVRERYAPLERQAVRQIAVQTAMSAVWELLKLPTLQEHARPIRQQRSF